MPHIAYFIIVSGRNIKKKFYCLRQVHLAEILPQATHTLNRVKTT